METRAVQVYGTLAAFAVAAFALHSNAADPVLWKRTPLEVVSHNLLDLVTLLLALTITWKAERDPAARLIVVVLLARVVMDNGIAVGPKWLATVQRAGLVTCLAGLVRLSAVFPYHWHPADLAPRRRGVLPLLLGLMSRAVLRPVVVWTGLILLVLLELLDELQASRGIVGGVRMVAESLLMFVFLFAARLFVGGYRRASADQRSRALWIVAAFSLIAGSFGVLGITAVTVILFFGQEVVLASGVETTIYWYLRLLGFFLPAGLAFAVFYRGALDPRLVIRRATVLTALGIALTFIFAILENVISDKVVRIFGMPAGTGTVVSAGIIAVVVSALHARIGRWLSGVVEPPAGSISYPAESADP